MRVVGYHTIPDNTNNISIVNRGIQGTKQLKGLIMQKCRCLKHDV